MVFLAVFLSDSLKNFAEGTNYVVRWGAWSIECILSTWSLFFNEVMLSPDLKMKDYLV